MRENYDWYRLPDELGDTGIDREIKRAIFAKQTAEARIRYLTNLKQEKERAKNDDK